MPHTDVPQLVGPAEIREMLGGVNAQRAYQISTIAGFPEPLSRLAQGRIWDATAVRQWIKANAGRIPVS